MPSVRATLLLFIFASVEAALKPKLIAEMAEVWKDGRPSDALCVSELRLDRGFPEDAAEKFLKIFDETIQYTKTGVSDIKTDNNGSGLGNLTDIGLKNPPRVVEIGDFVQIEIGGAFQLETPKRVREIKDFEGQKWVFIEGTETGFPMDQVIFEQKGTKAPINPPVLPEVLRHGCLKEETSLDEGSATLVWPETLSADSYHDLEHWVTGILQKAKRRAGIKS